MDFQRATQAYIWSTPIVSMQQWKHSFQTELSMSNGQLSLQETYRDKLGGLTYNTVTPYVLTFIDIDIDIDIGSGSGQMTKPGKYLIVG